MKSVAFSGYGATKNAHSLAITGYMHLQHRGQEGAGIVVTDGTSLRPVKGEGLVNDVFNEEKLRAATGHAAIAHVRYPTAGGSGIENVQPLLIPFVNRLSCHCS